MLLTHLKCIIFILHNRLLSLRQQFWYFVPMWNRIVSFLEPKWWGSTKIVFLNILREAIGKCKDLLRCDTDENMSSYFITILNVFLILDELPARPLQDLGGPQVHHDPSGRGRGRHLRGRTRLCSQHQGNVSLKPTDDLEFRLQNEICSGYHFNLAWSYQTLVLHFSFTESLDPLNWLTLTHLKADVCWSLKLLDLPSATAYLP